MENNFEKRVEDLKQQLKDFKKQQEEEEEQRYQAMVTRKRQKYLDKHAPGWDKRSGMYGLNAMLDFERERSKRGLNDPYFD